MEHKIIYMIGCIVKGSEHSYILECYENIEDAKYWLKWWRENEPSDSYYLDKCSFFYRK